MPNNYLFSCSYQPQIGTQIIYHGLIQRSVLLDYSHESLGHEVMGGAMISEMHSNIVIWGSCDQRPRPRSSQSEMNETRCATFISSLQILSCQAAIPTRPRFRRLSRWEFTYYKHFRRPLVTFKLQVQNLNAPVSRMFHYLLVRSASTSSSGDSRN